MATVKELKATARPAGGKGAARAERRAGRVPGVIYGDNQPPVTISVDDSRTAPAHPGRPVPDHDLRHRSRGQEAPRDSARLPSRSGAAISRSMSISCGSAKARPSASAFRCTSRTRKPRPASSAAAPSTSSPTPSIWNARSTTFRNIIEADVSRLEISHSLHLSDIKLPEGVKSLSREDVTLVTIVPPSGYAEEAEGGCGCRGCRYAAAAAAAAPGAAPAAGAAAPRAAAGAALPRLARKASRGRRQGASPAVATRRSNRARDAASCVCLSVSAIPARNTRTTGTISASWPSTRSRGVMVSHHGAAAFRARRRKARSIASGSCCCKPATFMNESGRAVQEAANFFKLAAGEITVFQDELELPPAKVRVKVGGGIAGHNGLRSISSHIGNDYRRVRLGHRSSRHQGTGARPRAVAISPRATGPGSRRCAKRSPTMPGCSRRDAIRRSRTRCIWRCRPRDLSTRTMTAPRNALPS